MPNKTFKIPKILTVLIILVFAFSISLEPILAAVGIATGGTSGVSFTDSQNRENIYYGLVNENSDTSGHLIKLQTYDSTLLPGDPYADMFKVDMSGNVTATAFIGDGSGLTGVGGGGNWTELSGNVYRSSGNVGIGTTNPAYPLHIVNSGTNENVRIENSGIPAINKRMLDIRYSGAGRTNTNTSMVFINSDIDADTKPLLEVSYGGAGTPPVAIFNGGNVGIGTTDPDAKFNVQGGGDVALTGGGYIVIGDYSSTNIGMDDNEIMARNNGGAATLYIQNEGGNTILNNGDGNVGIGTTVPNDALTIQSDTDEGLTIVDTGGQKAARLLDAASAAGDAHGALGLYDDDVLTVFLRGETNGDSYFNTGGNVGIGITTNLYAKLSVAVNHTSTDVGEMDTNDYSTLMINNSGVGDDVFNALRFGGHGQNMFITSFNGYTPANRRLGFFVGSDQGDDVGDERLSIIGNGNVGIGTTNPTKELYVSGDIEATGTICDSVGCIGSGSSSGGDVPMGSVMAFNQASCPTGWGPADGTSGTPDLRGQFIRGLNTFDDGATTRSDGNQDPDSRTLGAFQDDELEAHTHGLQDSNTATGVGALRVSGEGTNEDTGPTGGDETRPKNVALIYCVKTSESSLSSLWSLNAVGVDYSDGNVGIGTTNPNSKLHVYDDYSTSINAEIDIQTGANNYWGIYHDKDSEDLRFWNEDVDSGTNDDALTIANTGEVGIGTTNPEFKLTLDKGAATPDGGILAIGTIYSGADLTTSGAGTRLIWYPKKGAFRAGRVYDDEWDDVNIGTNSVAFGGGTTASGAYSVAMGDGTTASSGFSVAMGSGTTASSLYTTAMGFGTTASGYNSVAMGFGTTASGDYSFAMGRDTTASGYNSVAMGRDIQAFGEYTIAIALNDQNGAVISQPNTMTIMGGNVGIGTLNPGYKLEVVGPTGIGAEAFNYLSDVSLKKNIEKIADSLDKVKELEGVSFEWKENGKQSIGLIAQDVEEILPELVSTNKSTGLKSVQYGNLVPVLIEAIKEQQEQIELLQKEMKNLK